MCMYYPKNYQCPRCVSLTDNDVKNALLWYHKMEQCISLAPKKPITNCMELEL